MTAFGYIFISFQSTKDFPILALIAIILFLIFEPILLFMSYKNKKTRKILIHGWTPIIISVIISSFSGFVFYNSNEKFKKLATFQPVFNGFAGNCLALLASRISTALHRLGPIGTDNQNIKPCVSPQYAFCSEGLLINIIHLTTNY